MTINPHIALRTKSARRFTLRHGAIALLAPLLFLFADARHLDAQASGQLETALHLADHRLPAARLTDISLKGGLTFQSVGESYTVAMRDIVRWGKVRGAVDADLVWLGDGSWLAGQIKWKNDRALELASEWFESLHIPLDQVRGLVFQPPISSQEFADLERRMRAADGAADVVWSGRSEQLSGLLTLKLRQPIDESMPTVAHWELKASGAAERATLDNANLQAIVFSPVLRGPIHAASGAASNASGAASNTVQIDLRDGSRLNVGSLDRKPDGRISVVLGDGRKLEAVDMARQFTLAITRIAGQPARVSWLSQMEPARYRFMLEESQLSWPLGRDQDLFGKPLFVDNDPVSRAVVLHAPAQVAYRWDGRKARFLAEVSLIAPASDLSASVGSVQCRVLVARGGELVELFKSPTIRADTPPVAIEVDISDAQLVVLLADQADQGSIGDHVLWRDARLVPLSSDP